MEIMDTKDTLLPYFWTQWTLYHPLNTFAIKWGARGRRFKSSRPDYMGVAIQQPPYRGEFHSFFHLQNFVCNSFKNVLETMDIMDTVDIFLPYFWTQWTQ